MKRLFFFCLPAWLFCAPLKVDVSARAAILMNMETGAILYEKEAHAPAYPASITKIATALYALEKKKGSLDEIATATRETLLKIPAHVRQGNFAGHPHYRLEADGHHIGLRSGDTVSLDALLHGLLIASGNDAANVIARHVSGDIDRFMAELNQLLSAKGIKETKFLNPSGLYHPEHTTTAYDMALIAREAMKFPKFREIVKTVRYAWPQMPGRPQNVLLQTNKLLKSGQYYYPKAIGIKTGYTAKAGYTFVGAAVNEGRTLVAVLLGCPDINSRFKDAIKLFETAFAEKIVARTLFSKEYDRFSLEIKGAKNPLDARLQDDVKLCYYPAEEPKVEARVRWTESSLPIAEGQEVGAMELITSSGQVYQRAPLFALKKVEKTVWRSFADFCAYRRALLTGLFLGVNLLAALFYFLKKPKKVV